MKNVFDYAKFFMKKGLDSTPNSYDGNMKLQKLLVFADLISLAMDHGKLFSDDIYAFENGCVIESVRLRYKNDYYGLKADSDSFNPDFSQEEYEVLNATIDIFGHETARELSELNHAFSFWENAYKRGTDSNGFHDKQKSKVTVQDMLGEIDRIKEVLYAYEETRDDSCCETINGVTFYYDPKEIEMTDERINELCSFANLAEDDVYSIYLDGGKMVIY